MTFQPAINERSRGVEGRLKVLDDPASYVARLQQDAALAADKVQRAAAQVAQRELAECTFKPKVSTAARSPQAALPAYLTWEQRLSGSGPLKLL